MNLFKKVLFGMILAASVALPSKQANAGLILLFTPNPLAGVGMMFGSAGAITGAYFTEGDTRRGLTGIAIGLFVLSDKADQIEDRLVNLIPEAPNFVHARIAEEFEAAAKKIAPNAKGLKSVVLDSETAASIMEEISYLDLETQKKINHIMTVKIDV